MSGRPICAAPATIDKNSATNHINHSLHNIILAKTNITSGVKKKEKKHQSFLPT